jgi:hypothetical protein
MTKTSLTDLAKKLARPGQEQADPEDKPKKNGRSHSRHKSKKSSPSKMEMDSEGPRR